jgi:hypothetical protein
MWLHSAQLSRALKLRMLRVFVEMCALVLHHFTHIFALRMMNGAHLSITLHEFDAHQVITQRPTVIRSLELQRLHPSLLPRHPRLVHVKEWLILKAGGFKQGESAVAPNLPTAATRRTVTVIIQTL